MHATVYSGLFLGERGSWKLKGMELRSYELEKKWRDGVNTGKREGRYLERRLFWGKKTSDGN